MAKGGATSTRGPQGKVGKKPAGKVGGASKPAQGKTGGASSANQPKTFKEKANNNLGVVENNKADLDELGQTSETRPRRGRRRQQCQCDKG